MATQQAKPSWVTAMEQNKYGRELSTPSTGYSYSVRKGLVDRNVSDSDIGYNPNTGYVTVKGQNFMKPEKNYQGSTYTTQQNFNDAWNKYQKSLQQPTQVSTNNQTTTYNPYNTQNPYDQQLGNLINLLTQQAQQPTTVDLNQIYNSPQYAAYQAQAQRSAQQGVRAAQEALGSAGFGRSTALAERSQGIQNDANEYLQTQVIPQLMAAAQAEKQQQYQNLINALNPLMQQQGVYDDRYNTANQLNLQRDQLTGRVLNDTERTAIPLLQELVSLGNKYGTATPEQQTQLSNNANSVRAQLAEMGIDPTLYDPNLSTEQRIAAINRLGTPTLAAQELEYNQQADQRDFAYQQARDAIADKRYQQEFDEDVRRWGLEYALNKAVQEHQMSVDNAQLAISRMNAATSRMNSALSRDEFNYRKEQDQQAQPADLNSYISNINKLYITEDPNTLSPTVTNPTALRTYIISLGLPDDQTDQLMLYYGLPTN